ncbi:MAG: hypothetical protein ACLQDY_14065 [Streptosporangiaceae bacterium]
MSETQPGASRPVVADEVAQRIAKLETTVTTLAEALRLLARGLEDGPMTGAESRTVAAAARQAHELLLTAVPPVVPQ